MIKKENTRSSIISLALIVLLLLCVAEIVLGLLAQFHPPFKQWLGQGGETFTISPKVIKDEKLGHKLAPNSFEVDTRGFRNPSAPSGFDQSDIVVLGDQLVYGQGIEFSKLWTALLGTQLGKTVYNMSVPGYSPAQYYLLLDQVKELKPKQVILTLNLQDDYAQAHQRVYLDEHLRDFRAEEFLAAGETVSGATKVDAELPQDQETLNQSKSAAYSMKLAIIARKALQKMGFIKESRSAADWTGAIELNFDSAFSASNRQNPNWRLSEQAIFELIKQINEDLTKEKIQLLVLLVPIKEAFFKEELVARDTNLIRLNEFLEGESLVRSKTKDYLKANNVDYLDLYLPFRELVMSQKNPYADNGGLSFSGNETTSYEVMMWAKEAAFRELHDQVRSTVIARELRVRSNKSFAVTLLYFFAFGLFLTALALMRNRQRGRMIIILASFIIFSFAQMIQPLDFFPFSSSVFIRKPLQKAAVYRKVSIEEKGPKINYQILKNPILQGKRMGYYAGKLMRNPQLEPLVKRYFKDSKVSLSALRVEEWRWNFALDELDPARGFRQNKKKIELGDK